MAQAEAGAGAGNARREIKVKLSDAVAAGAYANHMMVGHTAEEFIMDFALVVGTGGTVVARVVASPPHMKRIVAALADNVKKYEKVHGPIKIAAGEPPVRIGFQPPD